MPVTTPQLQSYRRAPSAAPAERTLIILAVSAVAFGVAHAVEGVVGIARDIFRSDPVGTTGPTPAAASASPAKAGQHEVAGFFLIVGVACLVKVAHRVGSDIVALLRDIGGDETARRVHEAARTAPVHPMSG